MNQSKGKKQSHNHKYAHVSSFEIKPIINNSTGYSYLFDNIGYAKKKLKEIRAKYVISTMSTESDEQVTLWINRYEITPSEKAEGAAGNYARISIKEKKRNEKVYYTLICEKVVIHPKYHPQRIRAVKHRHPNWGIPVLRSIKNRSNTYPDKYMATNVLRGFYERYSSVSKPAEAFRKLFVTVYSKNAMTLESPSPIEKIVLEVKEVPGKAGEFFIDWRKNTVQDTLTRSKVQYVDLKMFRHHFPQNKEERNLKLL